MSLPHVFRSNLQNLPAEVPYLKAPNGCAGDPRIEATQGFKIGITWSGSPTRFDNHTRSLELSKLEPIFEVEGANFFSLQVGEARDELISYCPNSVIDVAAGLRDFSDTAAVIEQLDLVISVDTSVLHLAGALAKETWVLLPYVAKFWWLLERTDSVWYPSLTLYRQPVLDDWDSVYASVRKDLETRLERN